MYSNASKKVIICTVYPTAIPPKTLSNRLLQSSHRLDHKARRATATRFVGLSFEQVFEARGDSILVHDVSEVQYRAWRKRSSEECLCCRTASQACNVRLCSAGILGD